MKIISQTHNQSMFLITKVKKQHAELLSVYNIIDFFFAYMLLKETALNYINSVNF